MAQLGEVAAEIRIGEALPFDILSAKGQLLLARGQAVATAAQLEQLIELGASVDDEQLALLRAPAQQPAAARTLFELWAQAPAQLGHLLASVAEPGFGARLAAFVADHQALLRRDVDIAIYLAVRQDGNQLHRYGLLHALHTALVAELAASRLGWAEADRLRLVQAALTMNLAIVGLQGRLACSETRVTPAQRAELRAHPAAAASALRAAGIDDEDWLQAVAQHHERSGGGGYPDGIDAPTPLALVLRLVDVFCAKISPRPSRPALTVQEAARQMFVEAAGHPLAAALIKECGLYPPGDFVQLASGECAVVLRRGADVRTPLVAAITNAAGAPIVDTLQRDSADRRYAIVGPAAQIKLLQRLPPQRLYGLCLLDEPAAGPAP